MNIVFLPQAWEDYQDWRINLLVADTVRSPFEGMGKLEPLKYGLAGAWSRRITDEHRLSTVWLTAGWGC